MSEIRPNPVTWLAIVITSLLFFNPLAYADPAEHDEKCNECHGPDGVSTETDVPIIAGISAFIIETYMLEYRDEVRPCHETDYRAGDMNRPATDMCQIAKALSEDEITELAVYYGDKKFLPAEQEFDAERAALGAKIHRRECEKCHVDGGSYADDDASILAGQWMPFMEQVFVDYASGERGMLEDMMKEKMDKLNDEDSAALIHFYASLQ